MEQKIYYNISANIDEEFDLISWLNSYEVNSWFGIQHTKNRNPELVKDKCYFIFQSDKVTKGNVKRFFGAKCRNYLEKYLIPEQSLKINSILHFMTFLKYFKNKETKEYLVDDDNVRGEFRSGKNDQEFLEKYNNLNITAISENNKYKKITRNLDKDLKDNSKDESKDLFFPTAEKLISDHDIKDLNSFIDQILDYKTKLIYKRIDPELIKDYKIDELYQRLLYRTTKFEKELETFIELKTEKKLKKNDSFFDIVERILDDHIVEDFITFKKLILEYLARYELGYIDSELIEKYKIEYLYEKLLDLTPQLERKLENFLELNNKKNTIIENKKNLIEGNLCPNVVLETTKKNLIKKKINIEDFQEDIEDIKNKFLPVFNVKIDESINFHSLKENPDLKDATLGQICNRLLKRQVNISNGLFLHGSTNSGKSVLVESITRFLNKGVLSIVYHNGLYRWSEVINRDIIIMQEFICRSKKDIKILKVLGSSGIDNYRFPRRGRSDIRHITGSPVLITSNNPKLVEDSIATEQDIIDINQRFFTFELNNEINFPNKNYDNLIMTYGINLAWKESLETNLEEK